MALYWAQIILLKISRVFFTKWGDGACDLIPLFGLSKRQVRQVAAYLGAPEHLVNKAPTADLEDLEPGKKDEDALGLSYDELDDFFRGQSDKSGSRTTNYCHLPKNSA